MHCPYCKSIKTTCIDSRQKNDELRHRRYQCCQCGERFGTDEIVTTYRRAKLRPEDRPHYRLVDKRELSKLVYNEAAP